MCSTPKLGDRGAGLYRDLKAVWELNKARTDRMSSFRTNTRIYLPRIPRYSGKCSDWSGNREPRNLSLRKVVESFE